MIKYGKQCISQDDIAAVKDVLQSEFLTQGPLVPLFEEKLCDYTNAKHAVAVNSATSALHLACLSLGVGVGDLVWTSPNTFVASANCAIMCGADVDFVDIDPLTYNISLSALADKLSRAEIEGSLPKVVIVVHFSGQSCDMIELAKLSKRYGFLIIEDASHAIGARYNEQMVGGCCYSDVTVFSFHPVKIITTAEGGAILTNSEAIAKKAQLMRSHGVTRDLIGQEHADGPWSYSQVCLGYNYRMTDIQAALGISQLAKIDEFIFRRTAIAHKYSYEFASGNWITPHQSTGQTSAWHLYVLRLPEHLSTYRKEVYTNLQKQGVGVNVHYIPVHKQPYYQKLREYTDLNEAEKYYASCLTIPLHPLLSQQESDKVISAAQKEIERVATR